MTYDFALLAQKDAKLMKAINDAMMSKKNEVVCTELHKLSFFPSKQIVIVEALSENSPFHYKILPKEIKYSVVAKLINGKWEDLCENEIKVYIH